MEKYQQFEYQQFGSILVLNFSHVGYFKRCQAHDNFIQG